LLRRDDGGDHSKPGDGKPFNFLETNDGAIRAAV